ncbi:MAG: ABC transporter permease [Herpetosiphonaceae bacterium]|nr:ABC transporter permease [Herpetosiphonaceae bacterium]
MPLPLVRRWRAVVFKVNATLLLGGILSILLMGCALAAPWLAPHDPNETLFRYNGTTLLPAPYPPGTAGMPLGSDSLWRDMWSRLLYGGRFTLLFCWVAALVRITLGTLVGLFAGWYGRVARVVDVIVGAWSAVPSLLFALVVITLGNTPGVLSGSLPRFLLIISLTGWTEAAVRCRIAVQGLRSEPFIEAAYAIGRGRLAVLFRHILPNLRDLLLVEIAYAGAAVLLLVGELAFLGIFVGATESMVVKGQLVDDPLYAEWGSMLAAGLRHRNSGVWLLLEPVIAFTLAILSFNLLADGLRRRR